MRSGATCGSRPLIPLPCRSPQYYEIYKYKEVIGISITFMCIDLMGGVFNDLSLVFKDKFDVVAGITYSLVLVCLISSRPFVRSNSSSII